MGNKDAVRLPVVSLGAEHLAIGYLMRRNILAYKAPPNNQGYDLICIHPDPRKSKKVIRVQVKNRYQTGKEGGVREPEIFTVPREIIKDNHYIPKSNFQKALLSGVNLEPFKNEKGIEQIAKALNVLYPSRGGLDLQVATTV
jgi:hypothetical protein